MDIMTIIYRLIPWILLACIVLATLVIAYLLYQKFIKKTKPGFSAKSTTLLLLISWLVIVLGLTSFSRGANYSNMINLHLFSGYKNAWNQWSLKEFQLIIFNMLMFTPLGFLLPLYSDKFKRFLPTFIVSFFVTLLIEVFQWVTHLGIFELDDLFHNTLGSLVGYFFMMAILDCRKQKGLVLSSIFKALMIPLAFVGLIGSAFIIYEAKEFGNLSIIPDKKQNMDHISVNLETHLSENQSTAAIYVNEAVHNVEKAKEVAKLLQHEFGLTQQGSMVIDNHNRTFILIDSNQHQYQLTYFLRDGSWSLNNPSWNFEQKYTTHLDSLKNDYQAFMEKYELIPNEATYSLQDESILRWDVSAPSNLSSYNQDFQAGMVMITPSDQKVPNDFLFAIVTNHYVKQVDIISEQEAFEQIMNGNFYVYNDLVSGDHLVITDCQLNYFYDTKGYYQPIYTFEAYLNNDDYPLQIQIPALKH